MAEQKCWKIKLLESEERGKLFNFHFHLYGRILNKLVRQLHHSSVRCDVRGVQCGLTVLLKELFDVQPDPILVLQVGCLFVLV